MKLLAVLATGLGLIFLSGVIFSPAWARGHEAALTGVIFALLWLAVPFVASLLFRWSSEAAEFRNAPWWGFTPLDAVFLAVWTLPTAPRVVRLLEAYLPETATRVVTPAVYATCAGLLVWAVAFVMWTWSKLGRKRRYGLSGPVER